ncbi:MAG: PKD domain-containing protein [Bacteroidia bacterium]
MFPVKRNILFFLIGIAAFSADLSAQLSANFSASPIKGCTPLIVNFNDLSTGGPTSWSWAFGNSNTANTANPAATYTAPGVYSVTLTVNNGGTPSTIVKPNYIVVYNKPTVNFHASSYTVCVGQQITFTDSSVISGGAPPISSWAWDFADGNSQNTTATSVSHVYTSAGNYPVSVITADSNGCTNSKVKTITVIAPPNASFVAAPISACTAPLSVTFTNTSTSSGPVTYSWDFGNGSTSTLQNPSTTYTAAGSYSVTLIVSQSGCADTIVVPNQINIQNINVSFVATPSLSCVGQAISFTDASVPAATGSNWDFGDGNTGTGSYPVHTYTAAGTYTVSLNSSDANSCSGSATGIVKVDPSAVISFTASPLTSCSVPVTVTFTNGTTGAGSYTWDFGDGITSSSANPSHTYTASGTYNIILFASNPGGTCVTSLTKNSYIVISPPVAGFTTVPDSGCVPLNVTFTGTSTSPNDPITSYTWNYGDGNSGVTATGTSSNSYTAAGIFSPTLTVQTSTGCTDTFVCNNCIKTGTPPTANFSVSTDTICYGLVVNFTDMSAGATGWLYMFGDGATNTMPNATHVYADTGTYQVKLVIFNNGCSDTSTIQKIVVLPPKAVATYTLSCTNYFTVAFSSQSEGADSLFWDFGDGSMDSSNNTAPTHTYTTRGPKTVTMTAYNYATGCSNTTTLAFTIAQPVASYSVPSDKGCYAFTPYFASTSQDAGIYQWNFGDPATVNDTSSLGNTNYTYNLPGLYTVSLIITDVNGCKDSIKGIIKSLGPIPYFHADTLGGCTPLPVIFADSTRSDSVLVQWTWDFGDGTVVTTTNDSIRHVYTIPGIYNVTMSVKDTNGCIKSATYANYIKPTFPYPDFALDTFACRGDMLTFDANLTSAVGPHYTWDFGDGTVLPDTGPVVTHSYSADNYYSVSLTVVDTNGCDSTVVHKVRILKPTAFFNWSILNAGCGTLQIAFADSSQGYITNWNWDFGNGAGSTNQNPNYTYVQPGVYNASLIVTNAGGCKDTLAKDSIIVVPGPVGSYSFSPVSGCNPLTVTFIANSGNSEQYIWDFGDGTLIAGGDSITHTYISQGVFNPILSLENTLANGSPCLLPANNLSGNVSVISVVSATVVPNTITLPVDSIGFIGTFSFGGTGPYTYSWAPGSNINIVNPFVSQVMGTGDTLKYVYTVYDQSGCSGSDTLWVYSSPCLDSAKVPNIFSPNGDLKNDVYYVPYVCPHEDFTLTIFDRWGSLLFSSQSRNHGWDGKTNHGEDAPDGTYYYVIKVKETTYKGFLQLVR